MIYYDKGQFCLFSVNGKLLGHMEVEDSIKVRKHTCFQEHACERVLAHVCLHHISVESPFTD